MYNERLLLQSREKKKKKRELELGICGLCMIVNLHKYDCVRLFRYYLL